MPAHTSPRGNAGREARIAPRLATRALVVLFSFLCTHAACQPEHSGAENDAEQPVWELLEAMHNASRTADVGYFDLFADDAVFFGTDLWERWPKAEFEALYRPYMEGGNGWEFKMRSRHINMQPGGDLALFDEVLFSDTFGPCRGSGAARLDDGAWRIVRYHLDITIPNGVVDEVVPVISAYENERIEVLAANRLPMDVQAVADAIRIQLPDVVAIGEVSKKDLSSLAQLTHGYQRLMIGYGGLDLLSSVTGKQAGFLYRTDRFASGSMDVIYGDAPDSESYRAVLVRHGENKTSVSLGTRWQYVDGQKPSSQYDVMAWSMGDPFADEIAPVRSATDASPDSPALDPVIHAQFVSAVDEFEVLHIDGEEFHRAIIRFNDMPQRK